MQPDQHEIHRGRACLLYFTSQHEFLLKDTMMVYLTCVKFLIENQCSTIVIVIENYCLFRFKETKHTSPLEYFG